MMMMKSVKRMMQSYVTKNIQVHSKLYHYYYFHLHRLIFATVDHFHVMSLNSEIKIVRFSEFLPRRYCSQDSIAV